MSSKHLSVPTLFACSLAFVNCGNSDPSVSGPGITLSGGSSNPSVTPASGGATSSSGGQSTSTSTGGNASGMAGAAPTGGTSSSGGSSASAGAGASSGGTAAGASSGGRDNAGGSAGLSSTGGSTGPGGMSGRGGQGGMSGGAANGGMNGGGSAGMTGGATGSGGGANTGTCVASKAVNSNVSGSGPHKVVVETNSDAGIKEGTIFRPADLGGTEKYPIFVWGEGGCSQNGLSNQAAMAEIASYGYFVIADGTPNGSSSRPMDTANILSMGKPLLAYITWAIAENDKSCSAYHGSLDTTKVASNGFSCGGLMAEATAGDSRLSTWGITSSGLFSVNQALYKTIHTPVLIILGGSGDIAYENGIRDYDNISAQGTPIMLFSKALGHGGDLGARNGGDFTKINLAWLNWHLKGDEGATGKGRLVGSGCTYCSDSAWEVKSKNIE